MGDYFTNPQGCPAARDAPQLAAVPVPWEHLPPPHPGHRPDLQDPAISLKPQVPGVVLPPGSARPGAQRGTRSPGAAQPEWQVTGRKRAPTMGACAHTCRGRCQGECREAAEPRAYSDARRRAAEVGRAGGCGPRGWAERWARSRLSRCWTPGAGREAGTHAGSVEGDPLPIPQGGSV